VTFSIYIKYRENKYKIKIFFSLKYMENTAEKRLYKKPSSILNAEKARIGRANARQQRKDNPPPPSDDEYSEDEIVYVPTRKTKRKPQESLTVPLPLLKRRTERR
jgi:hypothetical protein